MCLPLLQQASRLAALQAVPRTDSIRTVVLRPYQSSVANQETAVSLTIVLQFSDKPEWKVMMYIVDIIWLPQVIDKLAWKHNVIPEEVDQVLFRRPSFRKVQKGHVPGENVYAALGRTVSGRYLIVFFIYKANREALILSTREMDKKERRKYERK